MSAGTWSSRVDCGCWSRPGGAVHAICRVGASPGLPGRGRAGEHCSVSMSRCLPARALPRTLWRCSMRWCRPATMAMAGPRFFGFVIGGSLPAALAANWLAGVWDQNAAFAAPDPGRGAARANRVALAARAVRSAGRCRGRLRHRRHRGQFHGARRRASRGARLAGWNVEADGLFGAPPITVIVGEEAHPSLLKALGMLGLGRRASRASRSMIRVACAPMRCRASPGPRSFACRPVTSTPARAILSRR